jgi:hypothetical protein
MLLHKLAQEGHGLSQYSLGVSELEGGDRLKGYQLLKAAARGSVRACLPALAALFAEGR